MKTKLYVEITVNNKEFKFYVPVDTSANELKQAMDQLSEILNFSLREQDLFE